MHMKLTGFSATSVQMLFILHPPVQMLFILPTSGWSS